MVDQRQHRGPHPGDERLFAPATHDSLRIAVRHLAWLLTRGYAMPSSLKLVGDRFSLAERQRIAVRRSVCSDQQLAARSASEVPRQDLSGRSVWIDGFNLLTTVEAALSGGVLLLGRDGALRDMASMHGSYRKVTETGPALEHVGRMLADWGVVSACWLLDEPVSNSGRLKKMMEQLAAERGWNWRVQLDPDPDRLLAECGEPVISADSQVLDACGRWCNAAKWIVEALPGDVPAIDLRV